VRMRGGERSEGVPHSRTSPGGKTSRSAGVSVVATADALDSALHHGRCVPPAFGCGVYDPRSRS
jgi:hypothetical protein